jgi:hypothetical protein
MAETEIEVYSEDKGNSASYVIASCQCGLGSDCGGGGGGDCQCGLGSDCGGCGN